MADVGQELLNVPFAEMVQKLALAVASGQIQLDQHSAEAAKLLADTKLALPDIANPSQTKDFALIALGIVPRFYEFSSCEIEVKMAITMATSSETKADVGLKAGWGPVAATVNASYAQKYSFSSEGSSRLYMKLAPVPPPTILQNYMDALIKKSLDAEPDLKRDPLAPHSSPPAPGR